MFTKSQLAVDYIRSDCRCGLKHIRLESNKPEWMIAALQRSWRDDGVHALPALAD